MLHRVHVYACRHPLDESDPGSFVYMNWSIYTHKCSVCAEDGLAKHFYKIKLTLLAANKGQYNLPTFKGCVQYHCGLQ